MVRRFRGESHHKVDVKGRVSIPASFRRVIEAGDPNWTDGLSPELVIVYGDERRQHLECFTMETMADVERRIERKPRGDKRRKAMQRLYNTQSLLTSIDETGRLVLPGRLREKIAIDGMAFFAGNGDTFEIWKPETYEADIDADLEADDHFDPNADPSIYLDGEEEA